jgi:hypothetical protein
VASDVSICSAALSLLGDKPIASLSEPNRTAATLCANIYPLAKDAIMRMHPWNCLGKRVILSPLSTTPAFEWGYQFTKPGDMLRVITVGYDGQPEEYLIEGDVILARSNVLRLHYTIRKGEGFWDALLTDLMIKRMTKDLAYPITKSASLAALKADEYKEALRLAKTVDGQENPPEQFDDSPFIAARGGASV